MQNEKQVREQFEKWFEKEWGYSPDYSMHDTPTYETEHLLEAYKAALSSSHPDRTREEYNKIWELLLEAERLGIDRESSYEERMAWQTEVDALISINAIKVR